MTRLSLPEPIAAYFAADRLTPEAIARCFTPGATVRDEGHTHAGTDAIRAWKAATAAATPYVSEPVAASSDGTTHTVTGRVTGDLPGSPIHLRYRFRLERGLVASLEIAP